MNGRTLWLIALFVVLPVSIGMTLMLIESGGSLAWLGIAAGFSILWVWLITRWRREAP